MRFVAAAGGGRLDKLVAEQLEGRSRQALARAFADGQVRVNGRKARKGDRVAAGDVVEIVDDIPVGDALRPVAQAELPLSVVWSDEHLVAANKPAGWPSHPLRAGETGTLANALIARYPECGGAGGDAREAGLAHRLDAGTSGLLLAARTAEVWRALRAAFHGGQVGKEYLALVVGRVTRAGELDSAIAQRGKRVVVGDFADALSAVTRWEPIGVAGDNTLLRCRAETGRMHQVRAHLAFAGTPVVGDSLYGTGEAGGRFFLHAAALTLAHPVGGQALRLEAPLPGDWPVSLPLTE